MLTHNFKKRPTAKEALADKWFNNAPAKVIDKELMQSALSNMKQMSYSSKLQQVTMQFMINNLLPKKDEKELRQMFIDYDKDGSGTLDKDEIISGLSIIYKDPVRGKVEGEKIF